MSTDNEAGIDGVKVPDTAATKKRKAKAAKRAKPKAKAKPKRPKAKKPAKRKPVKKAAKSKAKKTAKAGKGRPVLRPERIDMRVTKANKARIIAKAKRLKRTFTSVCLEALEKIK